MAEERMNHNTYPRSEREIRNAAIAREAAANSMVLLRNEQQVLPLKENATIAVFGVGAVRTVRGGTGSGDPFNGGLSGGGDIGVNQSTRYHINILDSLVRATDDYQGMKVVSEKMLREIGVRYDAAQGTAAVNPMAVFAYPEEKITEEQVTEFAGQTDTAVYVLSRNAGEGNDRVLTRTIPETGEELGDYCLSRVEKENLRKIREHFAKLVLVLNVGGPVAMEEILQLQPDSILFMCQAGQEGGDALRDVLTGKVNPSGKLTDTWSMKYEDNPASATFAMNDGNVDSELYTEDIYVGYRYFDSYNITPAYEFGFGLSYTEFALQAPETKLTGEELTVSVTVENTGAKAGREVVQLYVSKPDIELNMPYQELVGFAKTCLLQPGEKQVMQIPVMVRKLASYDEKREAYILSAGDYRFRVGTSSRNTMPVCMLKVAKTQNTELVYTELPLVQPLDVWKGGEQYQADEDWSAVSVFDFTDDLAVVDSRSKYHDGSVTTYTQDASYQAVMPYEKVELVTKTGLRLEDVREGRATIEELLAGLTLEELATFNCGSGWGVADDASPIVGSNSESVPGAAGEFTHILKEKYGIPSMVMADGPGGIRVTQIFEARDAETGEPRFGYHFCTAWPVGTLLAQSFDVELIEQVGHGMAEELAELRLGMLLGPGINIHRDPLCGRNFEYFSEDPLLSGVCAAAIVRGIQSIAGVGACIKHFAANNQETNRNAQDSVVGQRALREIYLKSFEIAVKEGNPAGIMTAYNKINSVAAADSFDLCTDVARGEWGFDGLIMTDWNGGTSTPWISMHAGNDLIMPGGPGRVKNIMLALQTIEPVFDERGQVIMESEPPFDFILYSRWNSFQLDPKGSDYVVAPIGAGHTTEVKDGILLVDGEPLYTETGSFGEMIMMREKFQKVKTPATTDVAEFIEDGSAVRYRGVMERQPRLCRGDVERCAANNLKVIMRSIAV